MRSSFRLTLLPLVAAVVVAGGLLAVSADAAAAQTTGESHSMPAVVRDNSRWLLKSSFSGGRADQRYVYGNSSYDMAVTGDWDGDGDETPAVIKIVDDRDGDGHPDLRWHLNNSHEGGSADKVFRYGDYRSPGYGGVPVAGDWNGDGTDTVGVVVARDRGAVGAGFEDNDTWHWQLRNSNSAGPADLTFSYGTPGYNPMDDPPLNIGHHPVAGDWDGDGTDTVGIANRAGSMRWELRNDNSSGPADIVYGFGSSSDEPIVGDWNGDGVTTVGVLRRQRRWLLVNSHHTSWADIKFAYGALRDDPVTWR